MDAAVTPQAINQLMLILNAAPPCAVLWPRVKEEKSAISCCLSVGTSKLITEMHSLSPPGPGPQQSLHSVVSEASDRLDKQIGWSWIMRPASLQSKRPTSQAHT